MMLLTVVYCVCCFPYFCLKALDLSLTYTSWIHDLVSLLLYSTSVLNPIMYAGRNKPYRQAMKSLLYCKIPDKTLRDSLKRIAERRRNTLTMSIISNQNNLKQTMNISAFHTVTPPKRLPHGSSTLSAITSHITSPMPFAPYTVAVSSSKSGNLSVADTLADYAASVTHIFLPMEVVDMPPEEGPATGIKALKQTLKKKKNNSIILVRANSQYGSFGC